MCVHACVCVCSAVVIFPPPSAVNYSPSQDLCVLVSLTYPTVEARRCVCANIHAGACTLWPDSLRSLRLSASLLTTNCVSISWILSSLFSPARPPCDAVECVRVFFVVLDFARGPDRVSMDGGAWLPLRTRYLPRWHHTGSYQLYSGEGLLSIQMLLFHHNRKQCLVTVER